MGDRIDDSVYGVGKGIEVVRGRVGMVFGLRLVWACEGGVIRGFMVEKVGYVGYVGYVGGYVG